MPLPTLTLFHFFTGNLQVTILSWEKGLIINWFLVRKVIINGYKELPVEKSLLQMATNSFLGKKSNYKWLPSCSFLRQKSIIDFQNITNLIISWKCLKNVPTYEAGDDETEVPNFCSSADTRTLSLWT